MADMQQLESAFLKAHKAGDTKAAGVLAAEIKRQRASKGSSAPTPDDAPVSGMYDQFSAGMESNTELPGQTVEALGKTAQNEDVQGAGKWLRDLTEQPKNFVSASDRFINPKPGDSYVDPIAGFGWGNAPGAAAEVGGQLAGDLTVRAGSSAALGGLGAAGGSMAGPGGTVAGFAGGAAAGALVGPGVLEFMRVAGPTAIERAKNNGRDVPTWEDWQAAAATAGVAGLLNSIGIKGLGKLNAGVGAVGNKTITQVVGTGAKESGKKAITEGVTETGQSVAQQTGETLGTDKGLEIDLKQAVGEGILGTGAGGVVDVARNAKPTFDAAMDIRSVNSDIRNNPDARYKAEITRDVNNISDRMAGSNKDPLSSEISGYASDTRRQIAEAIDGQNLSPADIKALKGGMTDARGLPSDRLDAIAARSENPNEIKALARKVQVIRELTMQKPTAKGARGWAALAASTLGGAAGYGIDLALTGGGLSAVAGIVGGTAIGRDVARRLRGSQTQGNAIDSLVGKKQARRAKMLLDRYGPSDATAALNTLTEQATARTAQENAQTEAIAETNRILKETKDFQKARAKMQDDIRKETDGAAKKAKQADKDKFDLANRELRLKNAALSAAQKETRNQVILEKLNNQKDINALTVEMTKVKAEIQQKQAEAKAASLDRNSQFEVDNLRGKMEMLSLEIEKRQVALDKARMFAKNAEKRSQRTPEDAKPTVSAMAKAAKKRLDTLSSEQLADPKLDQFGQPIRDEAQYKEQKARIIALENEGLIAAEGFPDKKVGTILIEAIRDFQSYRGRKNQEKRMKVYHTVMNRIPEADVDAHRLVALYIRPLATSFEADGPGAEDSNTTDYGNEEAPSDYARRNPNAEMDIPF